MYFDSLSELFNMSGHGLYVWLAYSITFLVLTVLFIYPLVKKAGILKVIKLRLQHEQHNKESS